ncbi:tripartite motif-containing protein 16-like [Eucyclogobius newberryi]|uniref:tripartite motif-containing protein 16-like n=1 Tax=Eucyclogobius newberryi TaxID=166745 RepID=UPI003B5BAE64
MAAKGLGLDQEAFCCSICLDLLKDPATIPCGHSYCMSCIDTHWNGEVSKQSYSCPQCRQNFTQRPVLVKNTMLAVLMEGLKKSGPPAAPVSHCSAAHGDVSCDFCSGNKVKAVKSCLQCLVSYCKEHLQPHYDVAALKKHKLMEPTENLHDNICSRHAEVMKMFCRTDQQCICYLCSVDEHKDHDTVTAAAERKEKQKELEDFNKKILQKIEKKEENVLSLQLKVRYIQNCADSAMDNSNNVLKDLIGLVEKRITELKMQIRSKQEADMERANELQDKLQQEITELKRKLTELDSLSHTEDHVQFLNKFASIPKVSEISESVYTSESFPYPYMVTLLLSELSDKILPRTEDKLHAKHMPYSQSHGKHPLRFTDVPQVVSKESLHNFSYWKVVINSEKATTVAVAYKNMRRNGSSEDCSFGRNNKSWALEILPRKKCCWFWHDGEVDGIEIPGSGIDKLGVFTDYKAEKTWY